MLFFCEDERDERGARFDNLQTELTGEIVAVGGGTDFGDGEAACGDDQDWSAEFGGVGADDEFGGVLNFLDFGVEKDLDFGIAALGFEHVGDVLRGAVAEKLAESFLVVRNAMLFDQRDEVGWRVAGERGFREVLVGAEEILRAAVDVREVAAAAAGDENFLADAIGTLEDSDAASALAGFDGAEESRGACAENESVKFVRREAKRLTQPRGCKLSLRSFLRLN